MLQYISSSVEDTKQLGEKFAKFLSVGDVIVLSGDLGAGKTVFVSGILKYYNKEDEVASPTFTIVNEHNLNKDLNLYHFDVYRLDYEDEFTAIGGEEFFYKGICIVEWGEKINSLLPQEYLEITIKRFSDDIKLREISFKPIGEKYERIVKEVLAL